MSCPAKNGKRTNQKLLGVTMIDLSKITTVEEYNRYRTLHKEAIANIQNMVELQKQMVDNYQRMERGLAQQLEKLEFHAYTTKLRTWEQINEQKTN
jgi:hypothetical protein